MKLTRTWILAALFGSAVSVSAQLQLLPDGRTQTVFGGGARTVELCWRNAGTEATNTEITARIFQASSATAVKLGEAPWKKLQVLPQQTVLESAPLDFPAVKPVT